MKTLIKAVAKKLGYMTDADMVALAQQVVTEHAANIITELGLPHNDDNVLDNILVHDHIEESGLHGQCQVMMRTEGRIFAKPVAYVEGSIKVHLYPVAMTEMMVKGNVRKIPAIFRFYNGAMRRHYTFILAHELRHFWQYRTGEYFKNETLIGAANLMPYEFRWCEQDANEFAKSYCKKVGKKK